MRYRPLVYLAGNAFYTAGAIVLLIAAPSHERLVALFLCALGAVPVNLYAAVALKAARPDPRRIARMERQLGLPPSNLSYLDRRKRRH
jgi:uncharacterized membrane protein